MDMKATKSQNAAIAKILDDRPANSTLNRVEVTSRTCPVTGDNERRFIARDSEGAALADTPNVSAMRICLEGAGLILGDRNAGCGRGNGLRTSASVCGGRIRY